MYSADVDTPHGISAGRIDDGLYVVDKTLKGYVFVIAIHIKRLLFVLTFFVKTNLEYLLYAYSFSVPLLVPPNWYWSFTWVVLEY